MRKWWEYQEFRWVNDIVVYEAEIVLNGKELDIPVSAKGKYLVTEKEEDAFHQLMLTTQIQPEGSLSANSTKVFIS